MVILECLSIVAVLGVVFSHMSKKQNNLPTRTMSADELLKYVEKCRRENCN